MTTVNRSQTSHADRIGQLESWHFWFTGRDQLVRNLLRRYGATSPVLDVGCGTARFVNQLNSQGWSAVALDVVAPTEADGNAVIGDATALPMRSSSVATVLARDVLEHVDDGQLVSEIHRVLCPGGILVALVPAWPSLWSTRDVDAGHLRRYTRRTLRRVLTDGGFTIQEMRGYQFALLPLAAASRLAERRGGRKSAAHENNPSPLVNRVLTKVNSVEASFANSALLRPPTGTSLAVVAVRS